MKKLARCFALACGMASTSALAPALHAATVADAMALKPVQADVDFETPPEAEFEKSTIEPVKDSQGSGWIVRGPKQQLLRRFLDTNGDRKLDHWCYYKDGVEVYRDIDANFNGKADQYRWMGMAGIRWGLDLDEDREIDRWKTISAEEVSMEVVAAIRDADASRFNRLLLTAEEMEQIGLPNAMAKRISEQTTKARLSFAQLAKAQKIINPTSQWIHFGGSRPGAIPAGTGDLNSDIVVYDNVSAVIETDGTHGQLVVGTLVRVQDGWRMIDVPASLDENLLAQGGFFFREILSQNPIAAAGGVPPAMQALIDELGKVEKELEKAAAPALNGLNGKRADIVERIIDAAPNAKERRVWIEDYLSNVGAAIQTGAFTDGIARLNRLKDRLKREDEQVVPRVEWTIIRSGYDRSMNDSEANHTKIHEKYLDDLGQFVLRHPKSDTCAEALLALAFAKEFAGEIEAAIQFYTQIGDEFPEADQAPMAAGARRRLQSIGKPLQLQGRTVDGKSFDLDKSRGKAVAVYYWATWCSRCIENDLDTLRDVQAKYARDGLEIVGISCDNTAEELTTFLKTKRLPWTQVYEAGGMENRLAVELGIQMLPTMILVDKDGKVAHNNIQAKELDDELKKLLRK